jgi:iron complex outermembrane receptor protein
MYFRFVFLFFNIITNSVFAQGFSISGRVLDAETNEPLQFAHVFVDQTTHGTVTNSNGEFFLENLEPGEYRLVFSFVGFDLFNRYI